MSEFFLTLLVIALVVLAMAVGVIFGRRPIQGSCGGLNKLGGAECDCGSPCEKRRRAMAEADEPPAATH